MLGKNMMNYREILKKLPKSKLESIISRYGSEEMIRMIEEEYNHFFLVHRVVIDPDSQVAQERVHRRVFCTTDREEAEKFLRDKNKHVEEPIRYEKDRSWSGPNYWIEVIGGEDL